MPLQLTPANGRKYMSRLSSERDMSCAAADTDMQPDCYLKIIMSFKFELATSPQFPTVVPLSSETSNPTSRVGSSTSTSLAIHLLMRSSHG